MFLVYRVVSACFFSFVVAKACDTRSSDQRLVCLPDVFFLGASKAGTSTVATILFQHPMISNPRGENRSQKRKDQQRKDKESHYFDHSDENVHGNNHVLHHTDKHGGVLETIYYDQIGFDRNVFNESHRPLLMDYTPNYLVLESVPEVIRNLTKEINKLKFIIMLRDPVKRVESSWKFKRTFCASCLNHIDMNIPSFQLSVDRGMRQGTCISTCYNNLPALRKFKDYCSITKCRNLYDDESGSSGGRSHLAHVVKSMYAYQLIMWQEFFKPSQFHIFTFESYVRCPLCEITNILNFLELPLYGHHGGKNGFENEQVLDSLLKTKLNGTPRVEEVEAEVTPELLKNLTNFFKPHNLLLRRILGWIPEPGYEI